MRFDRSLKAAVAERLIAWTHLEHLPCAAHGGGPDPSTITRHLMKANELVPQGPRGIPR